MGHAVSPTVTSALGVIGQEIRLGRHARGWTIQDLADRAGVSEKTVRTIEAGSTRAAIGTVFDEEQIDEGAIVEAAARKRMRSLGTLDPVIRRRRLYAFLARRGFDADDIRRAMDAVGSAVWVSTGLGFLHHSIDGGVTFTDESPALGQYETSFNAIAAVGRLLGFTSCTTQGRERTWTSWPCSGRSSRSAIE